MIDAAALLTYRAAWMRDAAARRASPREAARWPRCAPPKTRSSVIDMALQMHGGLRRRGRAEVERLYREIRALRIYEGATEIQQLIIGKAVLRTA